jgi:hypothetical protein
MASDNHKGQRSFLAGAELPAHRLVKFSAAETVVLAGAGEGLLAVGHSTDYPTANGDRLTVHFLNKGGTRRLTASAAITALAKVQCAANGKIVTAGAGSGGRVIGIALQAASGDNSVIEVLLKDEDQPPA